MSPSPLDVFRTDRLIAERLRPQHRADYVRMFEDARVMATLSPDGKPLPAEEAARWLQFSLDHWDRHGYGYWAIRTITLNQFAGRAGLKSAEVEGKPEVELAYAFLPEFWGQGLATEISQAILKRAFDDLALTEVVCFTLTTNVASQRVMQKLGFRFERAGLHANLPHVFYRLRAGEFAARANLL
ncbi:MAG TPA: GNAT family N-acetyltransferase [Planctomycetaceae bacterium]|jgi:ribosomal-protein-alanine N-acetyltransferase|nr:GNAT family N-acetyltransferase [Planctomycetaceae bacterium]